jgi:hypothetical protein
MVWNPRPSGLRHSAITTTLPRAPFSLLYRSKIMIKNCGVRFLTGFWSCGYEYSVLVNYDNVSSNKPRQTPF